MKVSKRSISILNPLSYLTNKQKKTTNQTFCLENLFFCNCNVYRTLMPVIFFIIKATRNPLKQNSNKKRMLNFFHSFCFILFLKNIGSFYQDLASIILFFWSFYYFKRYFFKRFENNMLLNISAIYILKLRCYNINF